MFMGEGAVSESRLTGAGFSVSEWQFQFTRKAERGQTKNK